MKQLSDNTFVSSKSYYFLLDFNEINEWNFIQKKFNKNKLKDLTINEYLTLFEHASNKEILYLKHKVNENSK